MSVLNASQRRSSQGFLVSKCEHLPTLLMGKMLLQNGLETCFFNQIQHTRVTASHGGLSYGSTYHTGPGRVAHVSYHLHAFHRTSSLFHIQTCFTSTFAFPVRECPEKISCTLCSPRCLSTFVVVCGNAAKRVSSFRESRAAILLQFDLCLRCLGSRIQL